VLKPSQRGVDSRYMAYFAAPSGTDAPPRRCDECGSAVPTGATWCQRCLRPVASRTAPPAQDTAPGEARMPPAAPDDQPTRAPRVTGWPRKALLLAGTAVTIAVGSTLLPRSPHTDPLQADVYASQLAATVTAVDVARAGVRAHAQDNRSPADADTVAALLPAFQGCITTLDDMGVPQGLTPAHRELRQACASYATAVDTARAWEADGHPGDLLKLRVGLGVADKKWDHALGVIGHKGGHIARGGPTAPVGTPDTPGAPAAPGGPATPDGAKNM